VFLETTAGHFTGAHFQKLFNPFSELAVSHKSEYTPHMVCLNKSAALIRSHGVTEYEAAVGFSLYTHTHTHTHITICKATHLNISQLKGVVHF